MMTKIFRDKKEPLYNRQNRFMTIQAFKPSVLKEILDVYHHEYTNEDLLALYAFTGGVAKYVELLVDDGAMTLDTMIDSMISPDSTFINEGCSILIEEFGKDYDTYFSILAAIAAGRTRRTEIESIIGRQIGGYLTRLEEDYEIIVKQMPLGAKPLSKNAVYVIRDNFFTFWFRFIFKYAHILEIGGYDKLRQLIKRDYTTYSGVILERYFIDRAIESNQYTLIGRWWDRKGENEIDMIAANEIDKKVEVYEIKRNRKNIDFFALEDKAKVMLSRVDLFNGYEIELNGMDMLDM